MDTVQLASRTFLALFVALFLVTACTVNESSLSEAEKKEWVDIKDELDAAHASGDVDRIAAAEKAAEDFEIRYAKERASTWAKFVGMVFPPFAPVADEMAGGAAVMLAPLMFRRGRKRGKAFVGEAWNAVKHLTPWNTGDGSEGASLGQSWESMKKAGRQLAAMWGWKHSSLDTERVDEGKAVAAVTVE